MKNEKMRKRRGLQRVGKRQGVSQRPFSEEGRSGSARHAHDGARYARRHVSRASFPFPVLPSRVGPD